MREKLAVPALPQESQECAVCHCFTQEGYTLRDRQTVRFVCAECYENVRAEYPPADRIVCLDGAELKRTLFSDGRPGFRTGYLMGKKESTESGYCITVSSLLESTSSGGGAARFFNKEDVLKIHKHSRETGDAVVGIFRTSPSGIPEFNSLDEKILDDMLVDAVYLIAGGASELQTAAEDRQNRNGEIGVVLL